jgi:hypothetical protein
MQEKVTLLGVVRNKGIKKNGGDPYCFSQIYIGIKGKGNGKDAVASGFKTMELSIDDSLVEDLLELKLPLECNIMTQKSVINGRTIVAAVTPC